MANIQNCFRIGRIKGNDELLLQRVIEALGSRPLLGLRDRCCCVLEPTVSMPPGACEVLRGLDDQMRVVYHRCRDRRATETSSPRGRNSLNYGNCEG
jgi:hypothetical protein